ncbi:MAG: VTT domain-containing protein [Candidatus Vogelbacteria bacterium]|nr:VTT domain-containing protein [Candidatus Vogelbacteria bacterium]
MIDLVTKITAFGYLGIMLVVFIESGLFIFFLPGDSLLFTAGFLASQNYFSLPLLLAICFIAAVAGDSAGYAVGKKMGQKLFARPDTWYFKKDHLEKTKNYFEKYGKKTIIIARFVPIVRTFAPLLAGVGEMKYQTFISYNVIGGALWVFGLTMGGYVLGSNVKNVDKYLLPIIGVIIIVSLIPAVWEVYKSRK